MKIKDCSLLLCILSVLSFGCTDDIGSPSTAGPGDMPTISSRISSPNITAICEDREGYIWIGTEYGLNRYNGENYEQFFCGESSERYAYPRISAIHCDLDGRLWVASVNGIDAYNHDGTFTNYPIHTPHDYVLQIVENSLGTKYFDCHYDLFKYDADRDSVVIAIPKVEGQALVDSRDNIWIVGTDVIKKFGPDEYPVAEYSIPLSIPHGFMDRNDQIWIYRQNGLLLFSTRQGKTIPLPDVIARSPLATSSLENIFSYTGKAIIFFTKENVIYIYDPDKDTLVSSHDSTFPFHFDYKGQTSGFLYDSRSNIWIGTKDNSFRIAHPKADRTRSTYYALQDYGISSLSPDRQGNLWVNATSPDALIRLSLSDFSHQVIPLDGIIPEKAIIENGISDIYCDSEDNLWLSCGNTVYRTQTAQNRHLSLRQKYTFDENILRICQSGDNMAFAGAFHIYISESGRQPVTVLYSSNKGIVVPSVALESLAQDDFIVWGRDTRGLIVNPADTTQNKVLDVFPDWPEDVSPFIPSGTLLDKFGNIWISTIGRGLNKVNISEGIITHSDDIVSDKQITSLTSDLSGNLWITTFTDLIKYEVYNNVSKRYSFALRNEDMMFAIGASALLPSGVLAFGTNKGLIIFDPRSPQSQEQGTLLLNFLTVNGDPVYAHDSGIISQDLNIAESIELDHKRRDIVLGFNCTDFSGNNNYAYSCRMSGVDEDFVNCTTMATYKDLPYGRHTFTVRAENLNLANSVLQRTIGINVHRPWWYTWWAFLIYAISVLATSTWIIHTWMQIYRTRKAASAERRTREQLEIVNKSNMEFFANMSHEFRTPLTMIQGAVQELSSGQKDAADSHRLQSIIKRNSNRMLKLVNHLLDFNKLENGVLHLNVRHTDAIRVIRDIIDSFYLGANQKNLKIELQNETDPLVLPLDDDKLEKVVYNLISNAIKYSTMGGIILVHTRLISDRDVLAFFDFGKLARNAHKFLMVTVSDMGIGIAPNKLESIFERYYQIRSDKTGNIGGTGIGLYMARKLVEIHHGAIKAENRTDCSGSIFRFILPVDEQCYNKEEWTASSDRQIVQPQEVKQSYVEELIEPPVAGPSEKKNTVLVIDDDYEMLYYLNTLLSADYNVVTHYNAMNGYNDIGKINPDIIISDVMMLDIDGYQFCRMVKENISYCHIPVILLTAKSTVDDQITGFNTGANAYITKPFAPNYLLAVINSQLSYVKKLRETLGKSISMAEVSSKVLEQRDKDFMQQFYDIMDSNLSNEDLNVNDIAEQMCMSRTSFYYKIKKLTGESPNDFFRKYKLNKAVEMMRDGETKIAAIAYSIGFTPSYFSKKFKEEFGMLPSEFMAGGKIESGRPAIDETK